MSKYIGNHIDFLKEESKRLKKTEEPTIKEEILRLKNNTTIRSTNERKSKISK